MKKYKILVLSVLLFAFTFFTFHDYVLESIDKDTQYELCYHKYDKSALDLASKVHDSMHSALDVPLQAAPCIALCIENFKPLLLKTTFISHTGIVPQKPPLV